MYMALLIALAGIQVKPSKGAAANCAPRRMGALDFFCFLCKISLHHTRDFT